MHNVLLWAIGFDDTSRRARQERVAIFFSWEEPKSLYGFQFRKLWVIEFFTIGVSVRLSDRPLHAEEKK